jgi:hypothetical protein
MNMQEALIRGGISIEGMNTAEEEEELWKHS